MTKHNRIIRSYDQVINPNNYNNVSRCLFSKKLSTGFLTNPSPNNHFLRIIAISTRMLKTIKRFLQSPIFFDCQTTPQTLRLSLIFIEIKRRTFLQITKNYFLHPWHTSLYTNDKNNVISSHFAHVTSNNRKLFLHTWRTLLQIITK